VGDVTDDTSNVAVSPVVILLLVAFTCARKKLF